MKVKFVFVLLFVLVTSVHPSFATVYAFDDDEIYITGTETISSLYSQLQTLSYNNVSGWFSDWMYYDSGTGEYVFNVSAKPGVVMHIALYNATLIIDEPIRVEKTILPPHGYYPQSNTNSEFGANLQLGLCIACNQKAWGKVEIKNTVIKLVNSTFKIYVPKVNLSNVDVIGFGADVEGWECYAKCPDRSISEKCCIADWSVPNIYVSYAYNVLNISLDSVVMTLRSANYIHSISGYNYSTIIINPDHTCWDGDLTIDKITGSFNHSINNGIVINNMWSSNHCKIEVRNSNWSGAVSLLTTQTNGNLTVRDTFVYSLDKNAIRVEGGVTLINTTLDPPEDGQVEITNVSSPVTLKINTSKLTHIFDSKGTAFVVRGFKTKILPNGTHAFVSTVVNVTKYPKLLFKVRDGFVYLVNVTKYNPGREYKFILNSSNSNQEITVRVSGFKPNSAVNVYYTHSGETKHLGTFYTKSSDYIEFTYNKGFSEVVFDVTYAGSVTYIPQLSGGDQQTENTQQNHLYDSTYSDTSTTQDTGTTSSGIGLAPPESGDNGVTVVLVISIVILTVVWIVSRR